MSVLCKNELLPWIPLISALGFLLLLRHLICLTRWVSTAFLRPPKDLLSRYGSWAIVTGCTDGIGRAFAFKLAQRGLNLILVSRSRDKLEQLSEELLATNERLRVRILPLDFDGDISDGVREIGEMAKDLDVGVLINNVGVICPNARFFHEVEEELWRSLVRINIEGMVRVTRAVLPAMLWRGRGAVVNMGSGGAIVLPSIPLSAMYASTKAFVDQFSRSLHVEYKHHGIDVQCQVPLYIATKMASMVIKINKPTLFVPSAEDYAEAAIRQIGYEARRMPYWSHSVQWFLARLAPESLLDFWSLKRALKRRARSPPSFQWIN
ncbi:hypothetical protein SAY87_016870 [Trapa incisa]|uniref:Uncharacterized protein n=1 Tax=Trapa incisa TaxID=236973 RepID=A0AAN7LAU8_9MYRT|nr:hypothetical protein SAY87_016870 [Trapa incisa]